MGLGAIESPRRDLPLKRQAAEPEIRPQLVKTHRSPHSRRSGVIIVIVAVFHVTIAVGGVVDGMELVVVDPA